MKILHLSNTPLSNAPANLVQCQNHYGHDARLYLHRKANLNKVHVGGQLWMDVKLQVLRDDFAAADVLHFHNYADDLMVFKTFPELLTIAKTKPRLIQYHSPRHTLEDFEASIADKSLKHAVIAQYHVREYPEAEFVVPNVVPIFDKKYQGMTSRWLDVLPMVSYAPSNINMRGCDDKGYEVVDPVLRKLEREGKIIRDVMTNVAYDDCMMRKRWTHVGVDEVSTGSYHLSALEYMSMGCATIVRLDDLTKTAMAKVCGEEGVAGLPVYGPRPEEFEQSLRVLLGEGVRYTGDRMRHLKARGDAARVWMETYWNPSNHVKLFEKVYNSL